MIPRAISLEIQMDLVDLNAQIEALQSLLQPAERFSERLLSRIPRLVARCSLDVVLGQGMSTAGAGGVCKIVYRPRFGRRYERLVSTLRTCNV